MKTGFLKKRRLLIGSLVLILSGTIIFLVNQKGNKTQRSISWAAMSGDLNLLKKDEAAGVSLDAQDPHAFNWTPLMAALYHQKTNIIHYLLTRNINLNLQDNRGDTALMWAITVEDTNTVKLLLEKGADVTVTNKDGADAFVYARNSQYQAILLAWLRERRNQQEGRKP